MTRTDADAPIEVVPYDPLWPSRFAEERELLERVLAPWLTGPVEHVGSTAVRGLAAKPVIDIMAGVESLEASRDAIDTLREVGYRYAPYRVEVMHWFCKPKPSLRTHHLHLVPTGSALWEDRLVFRDRLRADGTLARRYAELKIALAAHHPRDREAYTRAKGAFIVAALEGRTTP